MSSNYAMQRYERPARAGAVGTVAYLARRYGPGIIRSIRNRTGGSAFVTPQAQTLSRQSDARSSRVTRSRSRLRGARSSVLTGVQQPVGGGDSVSYYRRKFRPSNVLVKVAKHLPVSTVVNNVAGRAECGVGLQGYFLLGDYFTVSDVNLGHVLLAGNVAGAAQGAKTVFESMHSEGMITNMENVNARLTIYDVIARKDTDSTVTNPLTAISTGYNDIAGGISTDSTVVGGTPFGIPRFTEYFKVLKTTKVILSPGACHTHVVNYSPNKMLSKIISNRVAGTGIGRTTMYTIVKFHGTPINDVTTQTQVSTSHIALDYVQSEEYKVKVVSIHLPFIDVNDSLPASFTVAGNTMQDDGVELAENEA